MTMQFTHPKVGCEVIVEVTMRDLPCNPPKARTYTGVVCKSYNWDDPESFNMKTGLPKWHKFPHRTIMLKYVTKLAYADGEEIEMKDKKEVKETQTFQFTSERSGEVYTVTAEPDGTTKCSCKGFMFRSQCKHVNEVKERLM